MFTILPIQNKELLNSYGPTNDTAALLSYTDNGREIGHIALERRDDAIFIIGFSLLGLDTNFDLITDLDAKQKEDIMWLVRSAGSYAVNRGLCMLCCDRVQYYSIFLNVGFVPKDDIIILNLEKIFTKCENCK